MKGKFTRTAYAYRRLRFRQQMWRYAHPDAILYKPTRGLPSGFMTRDLGERFGAILDYYRGLFNLSDEQVRESFDRTATVASANVPGISKRCRCTVSSALERWWIRAWQQLQRDGYHHVSRDRKEIDCHLFHRLGDG